MIDEFKKIANEKRHLNMFIHELNNDDFKNIEREDEIYKSYDVIFPPHVLNELNKIFYIPLINYFTGSINTISLIEKTEDIFSELYINLVNFYMKETVKFNKNLFYSIFDSIEIYIINLLREEILSFVLEQNSDNAVKFDEIIKYLRLSKFSKACLTLKI